MEIIKIKGNYDYYIIPTISKHKNSKYSWSVYFLNYSINFETIETRKEKLDKKKFKNAWDKYKATISKNHKDSIYYREY